jgi:GT2 family glycosyltransferase
MDALKVYVVVPNWNGAGRMPACLDSLKDQTQSHQIIVVDNGSVDESVSLIEKKYPDTTLIRHTKNKGFAGGVNAGIRHAVERDAKYVALLNNDAVAERGWLGHLVKFLDDNPKAGIVTSKILEAGGEKLDSTGDIYTTWGLPYPRGRGEEDNKQYDKQTWVFGASGGASLYRIKMLDQIGLFDEDFFAYFEDGDISFRAQLAGWKVGYEPKAMVLHQIGATSAPIKGFATYHTLKNLPLLFWKNVPLSLMPTIFPRMVLIYMMIAGRALSRGLFAAFLKGTSMSIILWPKKLWQRSKIQSQKKVSDKYIKSIITFDLPPNADKLRSVRAKLARRGSTI